MSNSLFEGNYYHHQHTKTFLTVFGALFSEMSIVKTDSAGKTIQNIVVPISYAPKNKWVSMTDERPNFKTPQVQLTLPRMSFEITSMVPNMNRKLGFTGTSFNGLPISGGKTKILNPVPVDVSINLYAITKDAGDMFQIIEQILPYFQPFLTINYNILPAYNIFKDVQIALMDVQTTDTYAGAVEELRTVETVFSFKAPLYYFGPIASKGKIIKHVIADVTGGPIQTYETKVDPITANKDEPHTTINTWTTKF